MIRSLPLLSLMLMLPLAAAAQAPEAVYTNARIWTGDPTNPWAEALAVAGGAILAVGAAPDVEALAGASTRTIDLGGGFVVPGFIDNHTHFLSGGFQLASVNLRDADTPAEFARRLGAFAETLSDDEDRWITGGDWDHERWGGELPHRDWIDRLTAGRPVFVNRLDGHMALANTAALERAGITAETPDPEGGTIVRDPATGAPTGVLKDEAMSLVYRVMPPSTEAALDEALDRAMDHALALGVTQVHDVGSFGGWTDLATFRRAHAAGRLRLRVYSLVPLSTWPRLAEYRAEHGLGDDDLRWGGLKAFVDGSLGSTTAWFYDPYDDAPETAGLIVTDTTLLRQWILDADAAGLHLAIHAIGDRANDWLLDRYEETATANGPRDRRHRIEHAQHLTPEAIRRIARLGVVPSMQPYHAIDDGRWAEKRIGPERIQTTYAFASLLAAGATLTFGSDWTVAPLSPLEGIYAAVTRRTFDGAHPEGWVPGQKISVAQALRAYTAHNAHAGFQEERLGMLAPGRYADFVVLSEDLFEIDPVAIPAVRVLRTVVGGRERFVAGE